MPNGTYGGVRGRKTKVGRKLLRFPPTRFNVTMGIQFNVFYKLIQFCLFKAEFLEYEFIYRVI